MESSDIGLQNTGFELYDCDNKLVTGRPDFATKPRILSLPSQVGKYSLAVPQRKWH